MPTGNYQFELDGLPFGAGTPIPVTDFAPAGAEWSVQDQSRPNADGIVFGRDLLNGPLWTFEMGTKRANPTKALEAIAALKAAWRSVDRDKPGALTELRYRLSGRERLVYGRPRRFDDTYGTGLKQGWIAAVCDFQLLEDKYYDTTLRSERIDLVTTSEGGWVWPSEWPIKLAPSGERGGTVDDVGGDTDTPVIITVYGPISDFWVGGPGWRLDLGTSLAYDQYLVIDSRVGEMSVVRNDGASLGGALSRNSRLSQVRLSPGGADLKFGGVDATRTAYATFEWRAAYRSL